MKVLQVFNQYLIPGGEEAWVNKVPSLLAGSCVVEDLRFTSHDWLGPGAPSKLKQIQLMGDNPSARKALRTHAARFQPQIIVFHNIIPVGSFGLYFEARDLGIPCLNYIHNFRPFSPSGTLWTNDRQNTAALSGNPWPEIRSGAWQNSRLKTAILAWHLYAARKRGLIECVDHWLAISNFMRDQFICAGIPEDRISVIRHCWESPISTQSPDEQAHYLYMGRLEPEKGIASLVEAWNGLEAKLGPSCPSLVIAGDGSMREFVQQYAATSPKITCPGYVDGEEKDALIQKCKAVMVPSAWSEPLGLTTYEAYARGRAVIASRMGALQETVIDGVTGWHHNANEPSDIARAVSEAEQAGAAERNQRGLRGLQWLQDNANPSDWSRRFITLCKLAAQRQVELRT